MGVDLGQHDGCTAFLQFQFFLAEFARLFYLDADVDAELLNLVNNPSYTHLEDTECSASIPTLKEDIYA